MWSWLLLPVIVAVLALLTTAVSMLLSSLYVRFRDVEIIWSVLVMALFYGTPAALSARARPPAVPGPDPAQPADAAVRAGPPLDHRPERRDSGRGRRRLAAAGALDPDLRRHLRGRGHHLQPRGSPYRRRARSGVEPIDAAGRFSVVIVSHGAPDLLRNCLRSIERHAEPRPRRVTVVDSGSPDGTPDMVEREFPWVRLCRRPNIGFSAANNIVAARGRGRVRAAAQPRHRAQGRHAGALPAQARRRALAGHGRMQAGAAVGGARPRVQALVPDPALGSRPFHRSGPARGAPGSLSGYRATELGEDEPGEVDAINGAFMFVRTSAIRRGRPAGRGLLALHGGPRLVLSLLAGRLAASATSRRRSPSTSRADRPSGSPRLSPGRRLPPRHGALLPQVPGAGRSPRWRPWSIWASG